MVGSGAEFPGRTCACRVSAATGTESMTVTATSRRAFAAFLFFRFSSIEMAGFD